MHALTLSTKSDDNRPSRHLYIKPKPRRPSAISMLTLSDVLPINTRVSYPITRGIYLVLHQFQGLVSHISPFKHYSKLVSTIRSNRYIDIDTITTEWRKPVGCFIGLRSDRRLGITGTCDIADEHFSMLLRHVTGWTLQGFVLCWLFLLISLETRHYLYSLP